MNCLCYAAEMFGIFYSQWDYQMVNFSRILKFLTLNEFDVFGWNDPVHTLFFIRTSNFCLRLAVLIFFFHIWGWNVLHFLTEPCNATKKNVRLSTIKTHYFILSFFFFHAVHLGSHFPWEVFYKNCFCNWSSIFYESCRLQVCNFTKFQLLHRYFS